MSTDPEISSQGTRRPRMSGLMNRAFSWVRRGDRAFGAVLLLFVGWVLVQGMSDPYGFSVDPGVIFAVGLVAGGVLLLRGQDPVTDEAASTTRRELRPRSPLGVLTLSVAFVVVGVMILISNLDVAKISLGQMAAAALAIVGVGLLVGTWFGRSRFLIFVGILILPFVIVGSFMHFPLRGAIGDQWTGGQSIDRIPNEYEVLVGAVHLNVPDLRDFSGEHEIDISIAAGTVDIFVPKRTELTITGTIELGNASIGDGRQEGNDLELNSHHEGKPGAGHLKINITGGIASVYVERISQRELHGPLPGNKPQKPDIRPGEDGPGPQKPDIQPGEDRRPKADRKKARSPRE